jgi:hypothetical protein
MGMIEKEISVYAFQRPQNGLYWFICFRHIKTAGYSRYAWSERNRPFLCINGLMKSFSLYVYAWIMQSKMHRVNKGINPFLGSSWANTLSH